MLSLRLRVLLLVTAGLAGAAGMRRKPNAELETGLQKDQEARASAAGTAARVQTQAHALFEDVAHSDHEYDQHAVDAPASAAPAPDAPAPDATPIHQESALPHPGVDTTGMKPLKATVVELLVQITDRNWVVILFLGGWCPLLGMRAGGLCVKFFDFSMIAVGVGAALVVRYALAMLVKRAGLTENWFEFLIRISAVLVFWCLAIKAYADYGIAIKFEALQSKGAEAAGQTWEDTEHTEAAPASSSLATTFATLLMPFVLVLLVSFSDPLAGADHGTDDLLMPGAEMVGAGIGVLCALAAGSMLRMFGDSRFLLTAAFTFALYALVNTCNDILFFAFDVKLTSMF